MTERVRRLEDIFHAAADAPAGERIALVENLCAGDDALRADVESLLAEVDGAERGTAERGGGRDMRFLDRPAFGIPAMPERLGRYRIIRLIGQGGMGTVYEAEQDNPRRRVALKVIRPGLVGPSMAARFGREARVLGQLKHPGIAQIYEAGVWEGPGGGPYFAMELVEGSALDEYARRRGLPVRERLELMARVCDAVEHAHERGVIHRDLKPGNILVEEGTGHQALGTSEGKKPPTPVPSAQSPVPAPKILDFGIARVTDAGVDATTLRTEAGQVLGTVPYMSPEQLSGDPAAVDRRADVYALGVILYELLGGRLPHDVRGKAIAEAARIVRDEEPARLGSVDGRLRGDVETIVAKALDKDPARRYATAAALGADIRRHLSEEPIAARPASAMYQLRKFARRHTGLVGGVAAAFAVLLAGVVVSTTLYVRKAAAAAEAREQAYRANLAAAAGAIRLEDGATARRMLAEAPGELRGWEWRHLNWLVDRSRVTLAGPAPPAGAAFIADAAAGGGTKLEAVYSDGTAIVWDVEHGRRERTFSLGDRVWPAAIGPGGHRILCGGGGSAKLWDADAMRVLASVDDVRWVTRPFSPDGQRCYVYSSTARRLDVLESATGRTLASLPVLPGMDAVELNATGSFMVGQDRTRRAAGVDVRTGATAWLLPLQDPHCTPDGLVIMRDAQASELVLCAPATGAVVQRLGYDAGAPPGPYIGTATEGAAMVLAGSSMYHRWTRTRTPLLQQDLSTACIAVSPDQALLAVSSTDGTIRLWDTELQPAPPSIPGLTFGVAAYGRGGTLLARGGWGVITLWNTVEGREVWFRAVGPAEQDAVAFSPDGTRVVGVGRDGQLCVVRAEDGRAVRMSIRLPVRGMAAAYTIDGSLVAVGGIDGRVRLVDPVAGSVVREWRAHPGPVNAVAVSPDGRHLATATFTNEQGTVPSVRVWDLEAGEGGAPVAEPAGARAGVSCLSYNGDGSLLAWGREDGSGEVWDVARGRRSVTLSGMTSTVHALAFSPDGRRLAGATSAGLCVLDAHRGELLLVHSPGPTPEMFVSVCWDGDRLVASAVYTAMVALETGPPACGEPARYLAAAARRVLPNLEQDPSTAVADLEADRSLPGPIREAALLVLGSRDPYVNALNSSAWGIVAGGGGGHTRAEYEQALGCVEAALRVWPEEYKYVNTLGVTQYRLERWAAALETMRRSERLAVETKGAASPDDTVISAMCLMKLGRRAEAEAELERTRRLAGAGGPPDADTRAFLKEAEELIGTAP
jgi:WD40 repeat protein/tRNA A-37 threonylcarbamoyl transferase component Bud32